MPRLVDPLKPPVCRIFTMHGHSSIDTYTSPRLHHFKSSLVTIVLDLG
jgi:hypothetical protein